MSEREMIFWFSLFLVVDMVIKDELVVIYAV